MKKLFEQWKGSGNLFGCPEWNPQGGLCSSEENSGYQGIFADGNRLFILLFKLVEILISTKGVDKVDTLFYSSYSSIAERIISFNTLMLNPSSISSSRESSSHSSSSAR